MTVTQAYLSTVELTATGVVVHAHGPARGAMGAAERMIPYAELRSVYLKDPNMLVNGWVEMVTGAGKTQVHFRRKQQGGMHAFFKGLVTQLPPGAVIAPSDAKLEPSEFVKDLQQKLRTDEPQ